jgi:hypothetical protein
MFVTQKKLFFLVDKITGVQNSVAQGPPVASSHGSM